MWAGLDAPTDRASRSVRIPCRPDGSPDRKRPTESVKRTVSIRNAHPRLHAPAAQIRRTVARLDAEFATLPGDLPHLTVSPARVLSLQSKIKNRKSKISAVCPPGELSLVFLSDAALAQVHGDFMGDPTATDVITFEGDPLAGTAGEICVSVDTAASQARRHGQTFAEELTLYLVHGWLHLTGYDDLQPAKKRRMRAAEKRALTLLRRARAIPAFRLR